jgi:hypothetical protein
LKVRQQSVAWWSSLSPFRVALVACDPVLPGAIKMPLQRMDARMTEAALPRRSP